MTDNDLSVGVTALKTYVEQIDGWEADFVPDQAYQDGATTVINTWDSSAPVPPNDTDAEALKQDACGMALFQAITAAGYGDKVTAEQCASAANAIIAAVLAARSEPPTQEATT